MELVGDINSASVALSGSAVWVVSSKLLRKIHLDFGGLFFF
jgi:hypothetical protein